MITILSTGDRESDLFRWNDIKEAQLSQKRFRAYDCSNERELQLLLQKLSSISLLDDQQPIVVHNLALTDALLPLLAEYSHDVYVITPAGKLPKFEKSVVIEKEKVTDTQLKSSISHRLHELGITPERDSLIRLYLSLTTEDFMGKERISPLKVSTFLRQLLILEDTPKEERQQLFTLLVGTTEGKANQWELLDHLFSSSKRKQHDFFKHLSESMAIYEIMALAKSSLLLVLTIISGKQQGLDNASIASKLGKHPFYISSIAQTISAKNISFEKAYKLLSRLFNLEMTLKSGRLDDESIGFDFLLATTSA